MSTHEKSADPEIGSTTHFGFATVDTAAKAGLVRDVFDAVADRYDLMNDLMSFGIHRLWKSAMIDALNPRPGLTYLDVAGGTGDIAFRIRDRIVAKGGTARIIVADINTEMLRVGRDRATDTGIATDLEWLCLDAQSVPLPDRSVDSYTIAFGLRNVTDIARALREARRVLKPGGRFLCLEFSRVVLPLLDKAYDTYSFNILPAIGRVVAHNPEAYRYLAESIRKFPPQEQLVEMMVAAGFSNVSFRNYSGGIAALHSGWRI
ncbi:MAG: bifunctional demethylmenaquinone methyltransferase/2-methoxy-6-polyprenyl-1,4-benzoquinol methylase UbiE [Rhodospirillaceae bacterium]|nr:bifunctional demethylmenaquinone methyltransferase/2-methoxy-6-polyprenyl-1,4-benzoquinol methylase UbiE [Rhodospirillaceae bacterium]